MEEILKIFSDIQCSWTNLNYVAAGRDASPMAVAVVVAEAEMRVIC